MEFSLAPLEGITLFSFRNVHHKFFSGIDRYYTPFLVANQTLHFKNKEKRELLPENNEGLTVIPQVLTNKPEEFLWAIKKISDYGYREINFNLGCPSPTVVTRGKGSGMLQDPYRLSKFFDAVYEGMEQDPEISERQIRLSVKTRTGFWEQDEVHELIRVYNRFPFSQVIVHPRVQKDGYRNHPDLHSFAAFLEKSTHPVCYNGDINTVEDYERLVQRFPSLGEVMIGRGLIRNPALVQEILGGEKASQRVLWEYQKALFDSYRDSIQNEADIVHKMKEVWGFMKDLFPESEKAMKQVRKAKTRGQYEEGIRGLFTEL